MKKRLISLLLLAALCAASLVGCAPTPPAASSGGSASGLLDFRLGEGTMTEPAGEISYPLDGLLAIPEGASRPVVFILHGAHGAENVAENRYYQGFSYLAEALAEAGYLAISLNINRAFSFEPFEGNEYNRALGIFEDYRELLRRANEGEAVFSRDLTGKVDLSRISFIGHSRGGDDSLAIAAALAEQGDASVQSVLLVSSPLMVSYERSQVDVPTGVLLSQYDGDVVGLESTTLFNRAWFQEDRRSPVSMAFLYGGNHNQFNSAIPQVDGLAPPQGVRYLGGDVQREFLVRYAIDFLHAAHQADADWVALLGETAPVRYGIDFLPSLVLPDGMIQLPLGTTDGLYSEGLSITPAVFSQIPERNSIAPFNLPGPLGEDIFLYRLKWTQANQVATLVTEQKDWSGRESLSLLLASDPTDPDHREERPLTLGITLTDGAGQSATVELNAATTAALRYHPTEVENAFAGMEGLPEYNMAIRHTPLGVQTLPLSAFAGVDLGSIVALTFTGGSDSGACVFGGFRVN